MDPLPESTRAREVAPPPGSAPDAVPASASDSFWGAVVAYFRDHPFVADALMGGALFAIGVAGMYSLELQRANPTTPPNALAVVLCGLMTLPLAWRRKAPVTVVVLTMAGLIPFLVLDYPDSGASIGTLVAMYTAGSQCPRRRSLTVFFAAALAMLPVMIAGTLVEYVQLSWPSAVANYVVYFTAWVLGDSMRTRRAYLRELEHRAETAERQRDEEARRAVAAERDRIARELHDVVAHSMAVMVVQAGAARRVVHSQPDRADEALRSVEATGRDAMVEMRRLVGVLRDDNAEPVGVDGAAVSSRSPQPGLEALPTLVEQWQQAGLPIELEVAGEQRPLQAGIDLSAYRIVQEALTNTFKHAGPAHAKVTVAYGDRDLELTVTDDGRGLVAMAGRAPGLEGAAASWGDAGVVMTGPALTSPSTMSPPATAEATTMASTGAAPTAGEGHGLLGMRERVLLVGGELRAGPRPGGGFEVSARLPLAEPSSA